MAEEYAPIWIENMFKKYTHYTIASLLLGIMIYAIYWIFSISERVTYFDMSFGIDSYFIPISALSVLIPFQLIGIQYVLGDMRRASKKIENLYTGFGKGFARSRKYYIIIAFVIIPFILIELYNHFSRGLIVFAVSGEEKLISWALLFDIYNHIIIYIMLFLLATILWIMFSVSSTLNEMRCGSSGLSAKVDIFNTDNLGGLKPLRNFILKFSTYYFVCVALAIASYITPFSIFSYETVYLMILLLLGLSFILVGFDTIRRILSFRVEFELGEINKKHKEQRDELINIISKGAYSDKMSEVNLIVIMLEMLEKDVEKIKKINRKGYDLIAIIDSSISYGFSQTVLLLKSNEIDLPIDIDQIIEVTDVLSSSVISYINTIKIL